MSEMQASDYSGKRLHEGVRVEAWDGTGRYTARVKEIQPPRPACADHRHVILVRDGDHAEVQTLSDVIVVIGEEVP